MPHGKTAQMLRTLPGHAQEEWHMPKTTPAISVKDAVARARDFLLELESTAGQLQLEEVQLSEGRGRWLITLSYILPGPLPTEPQPRKFKVFHINSRTGEVISMKIRQLA